jgi:DNA-binding Xre family transcriptional regulator
VSKSLNEIVSLAVSHLLESATPKKMSHNALSKLSGCAQGALSSRLRNESGWTIDTLDRVCTALGTSVEEVIILGRQLAQNADTPLFPRPLKLSSLPPASDERLTIIVKQAAGVTTTLATLLNAQSVKDAMPAEYEKYRAGEISDGEMFNVLRKRLAAVESDCKFLSNADDISTALMYGE